VPPQGRPPRKPAEVEEVFAGDLAPGWHTVYVFEDELGRPKQWPRGDTRGPTRVKATLLPEGTRAVLVLCLPEFYRSAVQYLTGLVQIEQDVPPIVVMLLRPKGGSEADNTTAILRAQAALQDGGADDVCIKPAGDFSLTLSMSAMRATSKWAWAVDCEQKIDQLEARIATLQQSMWSHAATSIPGLPKMQCEGPAKLCQGEQVGDCVIIEDVGTGRLGPVYSATNQKLTRNEAIKVVEKGRLNHTKDVSALVQEVQLLSRLQHANIVQFYGLVHTKHFLFLHMELAGSRNLFRYMRDKGGQRGRLPMEQVQVLTSQLAQALGHCHSRSVAHCDVKPENVVISKNGCQVKLVDFGLAVDSSRTKTGIQGTMPFLAPELFRGGGFQPAPTDVWSLGVLVLEMLCGVRKLNRMMSWDKDVAAHSRLQGELVQFFQRPEALSEALEEDGVVFDTRLTTALRGALETAPGSRWTAARIAQSDWLAKVSV
jgi:hypothetical protein